MDYTYANNFWQERDAKTKRMPREQLLQQIALFLKKHNTCALATGFGTKIRCTTLAYQYRKGKICIFSEGGEKFGLLEHNKEVALTIAEPYHGPGTAKGLQIEGTAKVLGPDDADFASYLTELGYPPERFQKMNPPLFCIIISPKHIVFIHGDFKKEGYSVRQSLTYNA